jgi:hypothetical protein
MTRIDWDRDKRRSASKRGPVRRGSFPPSARQLRYLRYLAGKTGTSLAEPTSSAVAAAEIARLLRLL